MKKLVLRGFGEAAEVIDLVEAPRGVPGLGEVRVRMEAAAINPSDLTLVRGMYGVRPSFPFALGAEGVGRVVEVGPGADRALDGRRVLLLPTYEVGTWSEEVVVAAKDVLPVTEESDPLQVAMLGVNPATAYLLLSQHTTLMPGAWIGQTGGNSAMGQYVIGLARLAGVKTLSIVRREDAAAEVRALGGDEVIVAGDDLEAQMGSALAGKSLDLVLDPVGGAAVGALAKHLRPGGTFVSYGLMSGELPKVPIAELIYRGLRFQGFWVMNWLRNAPRSEVVEVYDRLAGLVATGALAARVDAVHSLEDWRTALARAREPGRKGKVLFRLG